jgi:hypothetical protein
MDGPFQWRFWWGRGITMPRMRIRFAVEQLQSSIHSFFLGSEPFWVSIGLVKFDSSILDVSFSLIPSHVLRPSKHDKVGQFAFRVVLIVYIVLEVHSANLRVELYKKLRERGLR